MDPPSAAATNSTPLQRWPAAKYTTLLRSFACSPIVTLLAHQSERPVYVHSAVLTAVSPFFRAALSSSYGFRESRTSEVNLEVEDPETVELFAVWAYASATTRGNEGQRSTKERMTDDDEDILPGEIIEAALTFKTLLRLYVFADRYCVPSLKTPLCIHAVEIAVKGWDVERENVEFLWKNTVTATDGGKQDLMRRVVLCFCHLLSDPSRTCLGWEARDWDERLRANGYEANNDPLLQFWKELRQYEVCLNGD